MDVDNDIDGLLLQQFSSLGTTDKDVLILEFQKLLGTDLNPSCCAFFLDMNNWNLQAAIGSYYDFEQPNNTRVPCMAFVQDITIGEGESVPPGTPFVKTWRIQNNGTDMWPPGCCLRFISGEQFGDKERMMVAVLEPGSMTDVSVDMVSPRDTGIYQGQWRMQTPTGLYFGEMIWVIIQVEESGLLGVTQQMSKFGSDLMSSQTLQGGGPIIQNPFASPGKFNQSPASSTTAQSGSLPGSPFTPSGARLAHQSDGQSMHSPVRTALFQGPEDLLPRPPNPSPSSSPSQTALPEHPPIINGPYSHPPLVVSGDTYATVTSIEHGQQNLDCEDMT